MTPDMNDEPIGEPAPMPRSPQAHRMRTASRQLRAMLALQSPVALRSGGCAVLREGTPGHGMAYLERRRGCLDVRL